jgi:hypothetical protein
VPAASTWPAPADIAAPEPATLLPAAPAPGNDAAGPTPAPATGVACGRATCPTMRWTAAVAPALAAVAPLTASGLANAAASAPCPADVASPHAAHARTKHRAAPRRGRLGVASPFRGCLAAIWR